MTDAAEFRAQIVSTDHDVDVVSEIRDLARKGKVETGYALGEEAVQFPDGSIYLLRGEILSGDIEFVKRDAITPEEIDEMVQTIQQYAERLLISLASDMPEIVNDARWAESKLFGAADRLRHVRDNLRDAGINAIPVR